jgi:hypothetical protein
MRLGLRAAILAIAGMLVASCGPSFQVVYEGDSRFEHCYALDENPNVLMQQKGECWSDWIKHYTYGQTRDRVEFAAVRYRAIMRAGTLPTDEAVMGAAPGEGAKGVTLAPTNAFVSPPKTIGEESAPPPPPPPGPAPPVPQSSLQPSLLPSAVPTASVSLPPPPGSDCFEACNDKWQECRRTCSLAVCTACDKTFSRCARGCFPSKPPPAH